MPDIVSANRRGQERTDRRKRSRGGRRANDPRGNYRRTIWLFAAYAAYLSLRSLSATLKRLLKLERHA